MNVVTMHRKLLTLLRSVGLLVSTNANPSVVAIDIPNQGSHADVSELDHHGLPGVFISSVDWRRL
jgi:hypothetical protein